MLCGNLEAREKVLSRTDYPRIFVQAEGFGRGSEVPNGSSIIGNWNGLAPARGNWIAGFTITFPNVFDFKTLNAEKQAAKANELSQQALYDKTIQGCDGPGSSSACSAKKRSVDRPANSYRVVCGPNVGNTIAGALRRNFGNSGGSGGC